METSVISAMSAVLGSLVGGSGTVATTWVTQRTLGKRKLLRVEIERREALYGEFISECSARVLDAFHHHLEKPEPCSTVTRCSIAFAFVPLMPCWQRRKESFTS